MAEYLGICDANHRSYLRLVGAPAFGRCPKLVAGLEGELPSRPVPCGKPAVLYQLPPVRR